VIVPATLAVEGLEKSYNPWGEEPLDRWNPDEVALGPSPGINKCQ
jgi:hypothetical protein